LFLFRVDLNGWIIDDVVIDIVVVYYIGDNFLVIHSFLRQRTLAWRLIFLKEVCVRKHNSIIIKIGVWLFIFNDCLGRIFSLTLVVKVYILLLGLLLAWLWLIVRVLKRVRQKGLFLL
jgi:hypothetical protein